MRFRKTVAPEALPGCCYFCRGTSRDYFLDTDMHIEFHGAVYICSECLREMAQFVGFEIPERVKHLKERISALEEINTNLLIERDGLEKAVDGLSTARSVRRVDTIWNPSDSVQLAFEGTEEGETKLGDRENESSESLYDKGMADVSANDSSTNPFSLGF